MSFPKDERQFLNLMTVSSIIPQDTKVVELFQDTNEATIIQDIKQRDVLFYDEKLIAFVVLHLPQCSEHDLKSYLSRLDLTVEVWATRHPENGEHQSSATAISRELISTAIVKHDDDPTVLVSQNDQDKDIYIDLIWETEVVLNRPKMRFQDACTVLVPKATIAIADQPQSEEDYLELFKPQATNLFDPLKGSRGFEDGIPYLPIDRLNSISPVPPKEDNTYHIQNIPCEPIPTHLAFITRLKYSKFTFDRTMAPLVASLDIEMIPFVKLLGTIEKSEVSLQSGKVKPLTNNMLPIECQSRDCVTFLYHLSPLKPSLNSSQLLSAASIDVLSISIVVKLRLSDECQPLVQVEWTTNTDFSQLSNSTGQSMQRSNRPPNLSIESSNQVPVQSVGTGLAPYNQIGVSNQTLISFSAADTPTQLGKPFVWQVLIVNRTAKPAKLAIIPLPRVTKTTTQAQRYARRHATRSSVTSLQANEKIGMEDKYDIAQANMDENVIYALQHSAAIPSETDIMSLTPEIRVGPLGPGQCHQCEIKLIAFKAGTFALDAIRVVDLIKESEEGYGSPGVITDIRELPDVIVEG